MAVNKERDILQAAIALFQEKGYHATSMQDLADAVGLQKGSLYHYIRSKEELLLKIMNQAFEALSSRLTEIAAQPLPARERLELAIRNHIEVVGAQLGAATVFVREVHALSPDQRAVFRRNRKEYTDMFDRIIAEGVAAGEFRPVDIRLTSLAILGMCNSMYEWYRPDGRLSAEEIGREFARLVSAGLLA